MSVFLNDDVAFTTTDGFIPELVSESLNKYNLKLPEDFEIKPNKITTIDLKINIFMPEKHFGIITLTDTQIFEYNPLILLPNVGNHITLRVVNNSKMMSMTLPKGFVIAEFFVYPIVGSSSFLSVEIQTNASILDRINNYCERRSTVIFGATIMAIGVFFIGSAVYLASVFPIKF